MTRAGGGITRRRLLASGAGGALALGAGLPLIGCGDDDDGGRRGGSVVVIGAGLAGLTAAFELQRKGWRVTVVEARDRVGGRVHTWRREFSLGQVAEAGGEFIDTSHEAILRYVKDFGLELSDAHDFDEELEYGVYSNGVLRSYDVVVDEALSEELRRFEVAMNRYTRAIDMRDPARTGEGLDARSVGDILDELELDPEAERIVAGEIRDEYGVEPDELSLLFAVVVTALTGDLEESDIERYRIVGGNDRLAAGFASRLGDSLALRAPARQVRVSRDKVQVVAGDERLDADFCVVAAPLPALREVEFVPGLPRRLARGIDEIRYGRLVKTALQYESRVWQEEGWVGETSTDLPIGSTWDATVVDEGETGILMTYAASRAADAAGRLEPRERVAAAVDDVERVFPGTREVVGGSATVAWARERFSGGAYSAWAPGQYASFWPAFRKPHGRIYWAGEHTDLYASYMEGAVRSGKRVASEIVKRGT